MAGGDRDAAALPQRDLFDVVYRAIVEGSEDAGEKLRAGEGVWELLPGHHAVGLYEGATMGPEVEADQRGEDELVDPLGVVVGAGFEDDGGSLHVVSVAPLCPQI